MDSTRYELLEVIGTGGMATVWRARDLRLDRLVAVKRPSDDADLRRFEREGRIAAGVVHPNVVRVYDVGSDEQGPYLVTELVDGPSVAEADPDPDQAGPIGAGIASALAALHLAGIVHGDVKPSNILLADGTAHLTDFGVARQGADGITGPVFATPSYAAPEVAAGGPPTAASDVYSLAIVVHEIVTGVGWSTPAMTQPLPPGDWAGILAPALAADPAERPDAATFARSLERLAAAPPAADTTVPMPGAGGMAAPAPATPPPPRPTDTALAVAPRRPRSRRTFVGAAVLGVLALVVGVAAVAARSGDQVASSPSISTSSGALTTMPTTTAMSTTPAPTTATTATVPATVEPASATSQPASPPLDSVEVVAAELAALIEAQPPNELKPKDARGMLDRLDKVVGRSDDPGEVDKELSELADRMARHLNGDVRDQARELIVALAARVGADTDELAERFDDDEDDDGKDDDEDDD